MIKIDTENEVARKFLSKSKGLIKDNIALNLKLGKQNYGKKKYSRALGHYREVLKLESYNKDALDGEQDSLAKLQTQIKEHFNKGVEAFNDQKFRVATAEFENVLSLDREYAPAIEWLDKSKQQYEANKVSILVNDNIQKGIDLYQNKTYERAKIAFERAFELDPNNEKAKSYIEKCDEKLAKASKQEKTAKKIAEGMLKFRRKKYNEAITILKEAQEIDPENQNIKDYINFAIKARKESMNKAYNDGINYFNEGNLLKARENLEKALENNPKHEKARKKLAEVKSAIFEKVSKAKRDGKKNFKAGEYDKANKDFKTVLMYDPENEEIEDYIQMTQSIEDYKDEAKVFMSKKQYGKAIDSLNNVLKYNKDDQKVKQMIKEASAKGKKEASKWFNEGLDYFEKGDLKEAENRFRRVKSVDPTHSEAIRNLSKVEKEIERKVKSYYKTGLSYYDQKNYKKAISEFNKVLDLKSNYKDTRLRLQKAKKAYQKTRVKEKKLSEQKVQAFLFDGIKLYREGKLKEAISEWEKVLRVYPKHEKALKYIKRAEYKLRELEKLE